MTGFQLLPVSFDGVVHSLGTFGEYPKVSGVSGLKPDAVSPMTALAPAGTIVVPELVVAVPKVIETFGVTVNVAVPTFPLSSTTVTVCGPDTPALVVLSPAGSLNKNTDVPCSVVLGDTGTPVWATLVEPTTLPTATSMISDDGPKPVMVAVTIVPTGPEFGDRVTVGVVSESVTPATLFQASVKLKSGPYVWLMPGRLTVALYVPRCAP